METETETEIAARFHAKMTQIMHDYVDNLLKDTRAVTAVEEVLTRLSGEIDDPEVMAMVVVEKLRKVLPEIASTSGAST